MSCLGLLGRADFSGELGDLLTGDLDEEAFGKAEAASAPERDDPRNPEAAAAERDGGEAAGERGAVERPGGDEGGAETGLGEGEGLVRGSGFALHVEADLFGAEKLVDESPGDGVKAVYDDGLWADGFEGGGLQVAPRVLPGDGEDVFLGEEGFSGEAFVGLAGWAEDEVDASGFEEIDGVGFVGDLGLEEGTGFASADLSHDGREEAVADGSGSADAESAESPLAEAGHSSTGDIHFAEDAIGVGKELFAGLGEHHGLAHPVKKATTHVRFQRLDRVADGGLGEEQFACGLRKAAGSGENYERVELAGVDRRLHR